MNNKQYHYVYLTTNIVNGKQYVGDHSSIVLNDTYIGSGRPLLQNAIKLHGKQNFKKEILEYFSSKELAFDAQAKYISEFNTLSPNGYNISPKGGNKFKGSLAESTKELIKQSKLGVKNPMYGKSPGNKGVPMTDEQVLKMKNHKFSDEHRENLKKSHKGQIPWNKGLKLSKPESLSAKDYIN